MLDNHHRRKGEGGVVPIPELCLVSAVSTAAVWGVALRTAVSLRRVGLVAGGVVLIRLIIKKNINGKKIELELELELENLGKILLIPSINDIMFLLQG